MPPFPLPSPTPLSRPFWDACRDRRLVLQRCDNCAAFRWTPQILCTKCLSDTYAWTQVSGRAVVYSCTVVHRPPLPAFSAPYALAVVTLEEGPLMLTNIVGCEPDLVHIDMRVEVVFEPLGGDFNAYRFRPAAL